MLIADAHLDLAYNALRFGRDLKRPVADIRQAESDGPWPGGRATVSLPDLLKGGVGLVFGTLFVAPAASKLSQQRPDLTYSTPAQAHQLAMQQLDVYHRLADEVDYVRLVGDTATLQAVVESQQQEPEKRLLGVVPLMEGADPVREPEELEEWYARGLRLVGPAWADTRYAGSSFKDETGLTKEGYRLLEVMAEFGFILDLTHMSEKATMEAMDCYEGQIVATHCNARALLPTPRHLSDLQIRRLVEERDGVIGIVLYNSFLKEGYERGRKATVTLDHVVDHIDHVCQLVGNARHVGIGSDFDGGFGADDIPAELDTAADLPLVAQSLTTRGYTAEDVANVMGQNWLRLLRAAFK